jgi:predicted GTPase
MIGIGKDVYTNVVVNDIPNKESDKVRAVVIGHCGSGKTYLFNNLCNTNYEVGIAGESLTRDISYADSVFHQPSYFRLYDTPGIDSFGRTLECAKIIRATLTMLPINLIVINARISPRFNETLQKFKEQIKIFKGYEKIVVFLASCLDTFT